MPLFRNAVRAAAMVAMLVHGASIMLHARPYAIDDLLKSEALGKMVVDPTGRWLIFEKRETFLAMERFDRLSRSDVLRSRLYRVDLHAPASAQAFPDVAPPGTIILGFSPKGCKLAIARLRGETFQLGIVDMSTGAARWLPITPSYSPFRVTWAWVSDKRLLIVAEAANTMPWWLDADVAITRLQPERWAATAAGRTAVTTVSSGIAPVAHMSRPAQKLVLLDLASGTTRVLAHGHIVGMALAPSKRTAALLEEGEPVQLPQGASVHELSAPLRQSVVLVELAGGTTWRPCAGCAWTGTQSWSPDGRNLIFWASLSRASPPMLWQADILARHATAWSPPDITAPDPDMASACDMRWKGKTLLVRAVNKRSAAKAMRWYRVEKGKVSTVPVERTTGSGGQACADEPNAISLNSIAPHPLRIAPHRGRLSRGEKRAVDLATSLPADAHVDAWAMGGRMSSSLVLVTNPSGEASLQLAGAQGVETLQTFNAHLHDVDPARMLPLHHEATQAPVTSWLVLPPGTHPRAQLPLVVIPYPGQMFGATPPADQQPGGERFHASAQLLAARGFAVLLPSLPMSDVLPDQGFSFAGLLAPALDAAIASGYVDPRRVGLWGHSYGAYAAVMAAAQTDRFRAVVASSGIYDLAGVVGTFSPTTRNSPEQGLPIASRFAWAESGQGRMGGPPWQLSSRYIANSPVYLAQKISAPLLIIAADRDVSPLGQAEQLFSALFRQGNDAQLVTYWGEGHVVGSPGNLRDMYARVFAFLARTLDDPEAHANRRSIALAQAG
ncbi:MAG: alpha/beta hydrolase family protein [Sphingobium sp.]